jgi:GNAT superfamily N-acetyltransferase
MAPVSSYVTRPLSPGTWDGFARLVEANNGVWGGCWCMGFHPEGVGKGHTVSGNRLAKQAHVRNGTVHQILVYDGDECVGWCQYGPPAELPNINNPKAYAKGLGEMPGWRIGCIFTGSGHRRSGVARAALGAALAAIHDAGGGLVEAYPEQVEGRAPQRGAYFHTGPAGLFEEFGFERDRKIAKPDLIRRDNSRAKYWARLLRVPIPRPPTGGLSRAVRTSGQRRSTAMANW